MCHYRCEVYDGNELVFPVNEMVQEKLVLSNDGLFLEKNYILQEEYQLPTSGKMTLYDGKTIAATIPIVEERLDMDVVNWSLQHHTELAVVVKVLNEANFGVIANGNAAVLQRICMLNPLESEDPPLGMLFRCKPFASNHKHPFVLQVDPFLPINDIWNHLDDFERKWAAEIVDGIEPFDMDTFNSQ